MEATYPLHPIREAVMRLLLASFKHETNTFSPVPTDEARFRQRAYHFGPAVREAFLGTRTGLGAFLELAGEHGAEVLTPVAAEASPSGKVHRDIFERVSDTLCEALAGGCDGVLLDLHGAMVAEGYDDGEGELLKRLRAVDANVPICINLDLHTNLTADMVHHCTAMIGYKTYPHVDSHGTGRRIGQILLATLRGDLNPVMAWGNRPLLAQTLRMGHEDEPMASLIRRARLFEDTPEILAATVFGGFPLADFRDAGLSVVVVADGKRVAAEEACDDLLKEAWKLRESFVYPGEPLEQAISKAANLAEGPIILLDHADNAASGGTQDVMTVLAEVLHQKLEDVAVGAIRDPDAVSAMAAAGVGAEVTIDLGGKTPMPAIGRRGESLRVTGRVRTLTDGEYRVTGPMSTGVTVHMGLTAVLDTGRVQIVVCSNNIEPFDTGVFTSVGIDPSRKKYLLLKSRIHYRAGFKPLARHTILCDGMGVCSSNNDLFRFEHVRRPIYPLDAL